MPVSLTGYITPLNAGFTGMVEDDQIIDTVTTAGNIMVSDGSYFDSVVMSSDATIASNGAVTITGDAVTYAKMQNVSATDKLLGRETAGAGNVEEIACTAAGRAILDDANAAAQLITLGLTATAAELNALDGITSTVGELNILDGVTSTAAELNYLDITTLGTAQASKALTIAAGSTWTVAGMTCADLGIVTTVDINGGTINGITDLAIADGGTGASTAAGILAALTGQAGAAFSWNEQALTNIGAIGCDTITLVANEDVIASGTGHITSGSEGFIVGTLTITDGSIDDTDGTIAFGDTNFTGVGTIGCGAITPTSIELGHASDTTLTRFGAGVVAIEGTIIAMVGDGLKEDNAGSNYTGILGTTNTTAFVAQGAFDNDIDDSYNGDYIYNVTRGKREIITDYDANDGSGNSVLYHDSIVGQTDGDEFYIVRAWKGTSIENIHWDAAYTHITADGSSHSFINQDLQTSASPTFIGLTLSGLTQGSVAFAGASGVISQDNSNLFWDNVNKRLGIGTTVPNAPLEVKGAKPGIVGGHQSGMFQVTGSGTDEFSNSVITGHNAFNGNTQLWYLGNTNGLNDDIAFINRKNAPIHFYTNNASRMTINAAGNVGIGVADPSSKLEVNGTVGCGAITSTSDGDFTGLLHLRQDADGPPYGTGVPTTGIRTYGFVDKSASYLNLSVEANGLGVISANGSTIYVAPGNVRAAFFNVSGMGLANDKDIFLGSATDDDIQIRNSTAQTEGTTLMVGLNDADAGVSQSRSMIVCDVSDVAFNFGHPDQANPTLFIHSINQATDEWISFTHDQTDGVIAAGKGVVRVDGAIASGTAIITASSDTTDVSGINTLFINPAGAVVIGGFVGGVDGQVLFVSAIANGQDITLEHVEGIGGATQDVYLHSGIDEALSTEYGGWTLTCNGTNWYDTSHAKHV